MTTLPSNLSSRFFFATILSLYNKWMFSKEYFAFPSPLFVTTLHMFVQFLLAALLRALWPKKFRPARNPAWRDYGSDPVDIMLTSHLTSTV